MRVIPGEDLVYAKDNPVETTTASGFVLRETEGFKQQTATVLASDVDRYKEGDVIIYKTYATQEIKVEGETHILVHKDDILGKVVE